MPRTPQEDPENHSPEAQVPPQIVLPPDARAALIEALLPACVRAMESEGQSDSVGGSTG